MLRHAAGVLAGDLENWTMNTLHCALFLYLAGIPRPLAVVYPMSCEVSHGTPFVTLMNYRFEIVPGDFDLVNARTDPRWENK